MNFRAVIISVAIVLFATVAYARDLSIEEAIVLGLAGDDLRIAEQRVEKVQSMIDESMTGHYPTLSFTGSYRFSSKVLAAPSLMSPRQNANAKLEAGYLLFAFGAVQDSINAMRSSKEATTIQKEIIRSELIYSVRIAYYSALISDDLLDVANTSYNNTLKSKKLLETQATVRASQSDLIKVSADIASRRTDLETAKVNRNLSYRLLKTLTELTDEDITLTTQFNTKTIPPIKSNDIISLAKATGDEQLKQLKLYDMQISSNQYIANSKGKGWLPKLSLVAGYSFTNSQYTSTSAIPFKLPNNTDEGYVGVALNFPIFDVFKSKSQSKQYDIDNYILLSQKNIQRRDIVRELSDAIEDYNSYQDILKLNDEAIILGQRAYDLSLARFLNGQASATELNDVERSLSLLKQNKVRSINMIYSSLAVIEKYVGEVK